MRVAELVGNLDPVLILCQQSDSLVHHRIRRLGKRRLGDGCLIATVLALLR